MKSNFPGISGIRGQLLALIFIIIIPVISILLFSGYNEYKQQKIRIHQNTKQVIDRFIFEQLRLVKQTNQLLKILSNVPAVKNNEIKECNQILQSIHADNPQYSTIVVASSQGIIDCCAIPLKKAINVNDRNWFKRIKETRKFIIDDFLISRSAKKASLPFAYPVLDHKGDLMVAVGAAFDLGQYVGIFNEIPLPKKSAILITDSNKKLLFQSDSSEECLGKPIAQCRGIQIPDTVTGSLDITDKDGVNRIYFFERLTVGQSGNETYILVGFSKKEIFKNVTQTLLLNFTILSVVILISVILVLILGNRFIIAPLNRLIERTQKVQTGDLSSVKSDLNLPNELQILFTAFESMVSELGKKEIDRDHAIKDLKLSEKKYRTLFENMSQGVFYQNAAGKIIDYNQKALALFGLTKNQFLGRSSLDPAWKVIHEDASDYPGEQHPSMVALKTGKPILNKIAGVFNPQKNEYVWLNINAVPQFNPGETKPYQVFVTLHDITQLKKAEENLSNSESQYRRLFEYSPIPLWEEDFSEIYSYFEELNQQGITNFRDYFDRHPNEIAKCSKMIKVIEVNSAAVNLHEARSKKELLENFQAIFTDKSFIAFKEEVISLAEGDLRFEIEGEVKTFSNEPIDIHLLLFIDKKEDGSVNALLATIDITERKRAEIEKKKLESRLVQSQKIESIGKLAGGIAHDFNNVLYPIIGFTQLSMEELPKDHPVQDNLIDILHGAKRARELVKRILLFSRQQDQIFRPTSLKPVIEETLKLLRSSIPANINIQSRLYGGTPV
jgi:PAS domain S-box-containing protein